MGSEAKPDYSYCIDTKVSTYKYTWSINNLDDCGKDTLSTTNFASNDKKIYWSWLLKVKENSQPVKYLSINFYAFERPFRFTVNVIDHDARYPDKTSHTVSQPSHFLCYCRKRQSYISSLTFEIELTIIEEFNFYEENMPKSSNYCTTLHNDKEFTDVVFTVDGEEFRAHKAVLANRSSVFRAMFTHEMVESKQNKITICDVEAKDFAELLHFIYTDSVADSDKEMDTTMAFELLKAADKYDLEKLKTICEVTLCGRISTETAVKTLVFADLYRADLLKRMAIRFIGKNVGVIQSAEWKDLMEKNFELANGAVVEILGGNQCVTIASD